MNDSVRLVVAMLRERGCVYVPGLRPRQLDDVLQWFDSQPIFTDAHVPQTARNRGVHIPTARWLAPDTECYCVHTDATILAPHLLEHALQFTDVAAEYLGVDPPVMYSANAFWTRPGNAPLRSDIQDFHRDADDVRFLALFILLTDTNDNEGAHELEGPDGTVHRLHGHAGACFLADTSRRHRGLKPRYRERGMVWFRWGISEYPPANRWDHIEPLSADRLGARYPVEARLQRSIRLLVS